MPAAVDCSTGWDIMPTWDYPYGHRVDADGTYYSLALSCAQILHGIGRGEPDRVRVGRFVGSGPADNPRSAEMRPPRIGEVMYVAPIDGEPWGYLRPRLWPTDVIHCDPVRRGVTGPEGGR